MCANHEFSASSVFAYFVGGTDSGEIPTAAKLLSDEWLAWVREVVERKEILTLGALVDNERKVVRLIAIISDGFEGQIVLRLNRRLGVSCLKREFFSFALIKIKCLFVFSNSLGSWIDNLTWIQF